MIEIVRIVSIIIFHSNKLWKTKFSIRCNITRWWAWRGNLKLIILGSERLNSCVNRKFAHTLVFSCVFVFLFVAVWYSKWYSVLAQHNVFVTAHERAWYASDDSYENCLKFPTCGWTTNCTNLEGPLRKYCMIYHLKWNGFFCTKLHHTWSLQRSSCLVSGLGVVRATKVKQNPCAEAPTSIWTHPIFVVCFTRIEPF